MSLKTLTMALVSLAVIAAGVFGVIYMNAKSDIAAFEASKAESKAVEAEAAAAKAKAEASAESSRSLTERAAATKAAEDAKRADAEAEKAQADAVAAAEATKRAEIEKEKAEAESAAAKAKADEAAAKRETAKAEAAKAKAEADKAKAIADEAQQKALAVQLELDREKLAAEKVLAEKALLDARISDIEQMEQELLEYKRELEERERALKPELTVRDIASADKTDDGKSAAVAKYSRETDMSLTPATRSLARARRISRESEEALLALVRSNTVERLERLYVKALSEDRVVDADFYRQQIKAMYPDWKYAKKETETK